MQAKKQLLEPTWNNGLVPNWERSTSSLYIATLLFKFYAEHIMRTARLDEAQTGIKIARRNINKFKHHTYGRKRRGTKEPADESERGE